MIFQIIPLSYFDQNKLITPVMENAWFINETTAIDLSQCTKMVCFFKLFCFFKASFFFRKIATPVVYQLLLILNVLLLLWQTVKKILKQSPSHTLESILLVTIGLKLFPLKT